MINKKETILDIIDKISDLDFQRTVWVEQKYWHYVLNYGEAVNTLDDYGFFDDIEKGSLKLGDQQDQCILNHFVRSLLDYEEPHCSEDILKDEQWVEVTLLAAHLKKMLEHINW